MKWGYIMLTCFLIMIVGFLVGMAGHNDTLAIVFMLGGLAGTIVADLKISKEKSQ